MAYTHVSTLTTGNSNTYSNSAEWIAEHGPCGINHEQVESGSIAADGSGTVTRTLVYANEAARDAHFAASADARASRAFTPTVVSAG